MTGAPRFHTTLRHRKSLRQIRQFLEHIRYFNLLCKAVSDRRAEICLVFSLNHKYYFFKSCTDRVINRKIHDDVAIFIDRIDLLQSAVPAAHAGSHYYQYRFLHFLFPPDCFGIFLYPAACFAKVPRFSFYPQVLHTFARHIPHEYLS